jgi:hypothetical protein
MAFDLANVPFMPTKHAVIVPSDTVPFPWPTMVLTMAAIASLTVKDEDGNSVAYTNVPAWTVLPITALQVMATGTTGGAGATGLVGIYGYG